MFDRSNKDRLSPGARFFMILLCATVVFVSTSRAADDDGRRRERRPRQRRSRDRATDSAREAEDAFGDLDDQLREVLELVNQGKRLQNNQIAANARILKQNKKHFKSFKDDKEKACEYYMLQGWNDYFSGKLERALKTMTKAYSTDRENNDARLSQGGLAIAAGEKPKQLPPIKEKKEKPSKTTNNRQQRERRPRTRTGPSQPGAMGPMGPGFMGPGAMGPMGPGFMGPGGGYETQVTRRDSGSISSGDILEFDLDDINDDLIGKTVSPLRLNCLNATNISYQPGRDVLCAVFWKLGLEPVGEDPNDGTKERTKSRRRGRRQSPQPSYMGPMGPGFMGPGGPAMTQQVPSDPLDVQMKAYSDMFGSKFTDSSVKFVAVNLDEAEHKPAVMKRLLKSPWPMAQVMAKDPQSGGGEILPGQLEDINKTKQAMIITQKNGTVRYAGPAKGFVPFLVLDTVKLGDSGVAASPVPSISVPEDKKTTQVESEEKAPRPRPSGRKKASEELDDVNPQASKLLENAKAFMKIGTRFTTPKQGIELCRQIIREYPDTTYAAEARKLLRGLPERHQKRYKITDEEMGL